MSTMSRSPLLLRGKTGKFLLTNGRQWILCLVMNKFFSIFAALTLSSAAASAQTNQFNPTSPVNFVDQGGFTGTFTPPATEPFVQARLFFSFSGLVPSPLSTPFSITNISLEGPGIASSLSFSSINITGNGNFSTALQSLNNNVASLNFVESLVTFSTPGGVINDGAAFTVRVQYSDASLTQVGTSSIVVYEAVPEPSTYALLVVSALGLAAHVIRRRQRT